MKTGVQLKTKQASHGFVRSAVLTAITNILPDVAGLHNSCTAALLSWVLLYKHGCTAFMHCRISLLLSAVAAKQLRNTAAMLQRWTASPAANPCLQLLEQLGRDSLHLHHVVEAQAVVELQDDDLAK
jgi:hypothetical protein